MRITEEQVRGAIKAGIAPKVAEIQAELSRLREEVAAGVQLANAVDDYFLWEPGRAGHARAHNDLREAFTRWEERISE